jgi:hypothetical protein
LDNILPTIAGAGLSYFSGGAITPMMAAGIVGGISALDSKDLSKGLMAGLGAYGGGSMVSGLAGMGLGEGVSATATAPAQEAAMQAAKGDAYQNAVEKGAGSFGELFKTAPMEALSAAGGGSGYKAAGILGAAAAPMIADEMVETTTEAPEQERGMIRPYTYSRQQTPQSYQGQQGYTGPVSGERRYFNDSYTAGDPYKAAGGGLVALARGGYSGRGEYRGNDESSGSIGHFGIDEYGRTSGNPDFGKPSTTLRKISDGPGYFDPIGSDKRFTTLPIGPLYPREKNTQRGYDQRDLFKPTTPLPANNMTGDSREAYDYLMGNTNRTQVGTGGTGDGTGEVDLQVVVYGPDGQMYSSPGAARRAGVYNYTMQPPSTNTGDTSNPNTPATGKGKYEFDPVTKQYKWIPDPIKPVDVTVPVPVNPSQGGGGGRGEREPEDPNSFSAQWAAMNDAEREAFRLENPKTAMAQDAVGLLVSPLKFAYDKLQTFMGPDSSTGGPARYTPAAPDANPSEIAKQANPMGLDPRQQAEAFDRASPPGRLGSDAGANAAPPGGPPSGERGGGRDGGGGGGSRDAGGERGYSGDNSGDNRGWGSRDAGGGDARGGYLQHGRFDQRMAHGGIANLHQYNLGSYSDGGRLLKGPGDGVSDDIPATIGNGQPARLADGEFVIPARIVSELGNGSTDAGARALYKMMDRIQAGRRKTVGKDQVAKNSKSGRHLPA